jgi:phosphatidylserine decarboxylase
LIEEKTPSLKLLKCLYNTNIGRIGLWALFKRKFLSGLSGLYMNTRFSKSMIENFIADNQIDINEYKKTVPDFDCFNDFFYRKIHEDAREIQEGFVSPADGRVLAFEQIKKADNFFVKGSSFSLKSYLKDEELAKKYIDGAMLIVRLAPADYHRFHFPCDGSIGKTNNIKGYYYSVSPYALQHNTRIFLENKREFSILKSEKYGDVLYSEVGATMVGSIIQTYSPDSHIKKGQEKGYFAFGGSTLILFFEKGKIKFHKNLIENTQNSYETYVKMGEMIAE